MLPRDETDMQVEQRNACGLCLDGIALFYKSEGICSKGTITDSTSCPPRPSWRRIIGWSVLVACDLLLIDASAIFLPYVLPPFQIISHSKNLGESKFFKFDQIYIIK